MAANRDRSRSDSLTQWVLPTLATACAAFAPILWDIAFAQNQARFANPWFYLFLVATLAALTFTVLQAIISSRRTTALRQSVSEFNHSLADTIRAIGLIPDATNGAQARDAFFETVVKEAKSIIPLQSPRVCVYELDSADDSDLNTNTEARSFLRLIKSGGRNDPPRELFTEQDEHGRAAITNARGHSVRCVDNVRKASFAVQRDPEALWKSFVLVPLKVDGKPRGMVTFDTTASTRFTNDHIAVAMTIAALIEVGMRRMSHAAQETQPEVQSALELLNAAPSDGAASSGMSEPGTTVS